MKRKNNFGKVLLILTGITFIIITLIFFYGYRNTFDGVDAEQAITTIIFTLMFALIMSFSSFGMIWGVYFCYKLASKKVHKEKLSEADLQEYKGYFRDILNEYNPAELSYIDDFVIDYPKDIVVTLLNLQNKGKIILNEDTKTIDITNKDVPLTNSEIYILTGIFNGKLRRITPTFYQREVEKDALNANLIETKGLNITKEKIVKAIVIFMIFTICTPNLSFLFGFDETPIGMLITALCILLFIGFTFFITFYLPVYAIIYLIKKTKNPYVRTELGEETNKKLEGLKNYLKDFSNLDKSKANELIIWEEYLIYSVLFDQNKKVLNEIYNNYFEK